jgi:hypothetical protein
MQHQAPANATGDMLMLTVPVPAAWAEQRKLLGFH